jgi:GntR family transcriptional repressor for pyruvate dehydrogenase complex
MAMTAAIDASSDELDVLDEILVKMGTAGSVDAFAQCQLDFHIGLARASHNPVIMLIIDGLTSVIRVVMTSHIRKISVVKGSFDRSLLTYKSVIQALRDREPETARLALQECYTLWRRESSKISMLSVKE